MEFRILGPLEVSAGDGAIKLGGPKQRAVLAHLILRANRPVPIVRAVLVGMLPEAAGGACRDDAGGRSLDLTQDQT